MKRTFTLFAAILLLAVGAAAQKLSYQAVVRNSANELVYDATVSVSLKILAADGVTVQYAETQTATTNQNGLLTLIIGEHPTGSYSLTNVNWTDASIRTDITLPTGDVVTNTMPVTAVPYALYADGAGGNLDQVQSDWAETNTASKAYIQNKPTIPTVPTNVSAFQNDAQYVTQTQLDNAGYLTGYTETDPQFNAWDKDYNDLTNKPTIPTVPTNVSAFQNDAGYLTSYTETDPQFNAWDKDYNDLTNKPTIPTVPTNVSAFQNDAGYLTSYTETDPQFNAWDKDYNDLTNKPTIPTVPTNVSAFQNDAGYLTSYTETDPQFNAWDKDYDDLTNKPNIPVVNNATLTIKQGNATLGTFTANASVNQEIEIPTQAIPDQVNADWNATDGPAKILNKPTIPTVPTNVSAFQNDAGYLTGYTETDPQFNAWDKDYNDLTNKPTIPTVPTNVSAFQNDAGYLTSYTETDPQFNAWDKDYNDLTNKPAIPTVPTNVSAFQNDAQYVTQTQLDNAGYLTGYTETDPQFNAWNKDYNDLTNKPTIPTVPTNVSAFQNDAGYLTSYTETDPQFNAWNKDYNDLTNKPTIPTVPTSVSAFQNDAGYLTSYTETDPQFNAWDKDYNDLTNKPTIPTVPTNVSAFQNDAQYVTQTQLDNAGYLTGYTETDPQFNAWDKDYNDLTNKPTIPTVPTSVSAFQNDAGYLTSYTETQSLADVTAKGNSAGNRQLKNVSDPTDAQDAVTKSYLAAQTETITASIQQQLANLADQYQQQLGALTSSFQHQLDSLGGVIEAQQHLLDSLINGGSTPIPPTPAAPTATTSPATDLTQTSATLNGTVSNPDNVTITAQGFEWKATEGGTYAQVNATGEPMTYSLTGLTASTSYTYRAFVTTANGTSYGEEVTFTTLSAGGTAVIDEKSCPEAQTVTDHEGNVYATVQIGNQCWMRGNLRTTTSPSTGTYLIPAANANYTYTGKQARWFNNDSATYAPMNYGLLYNWNAAVDTFNTAYGETSVNTSSSNAVSVTFNGHRRGICPAGWHLPSDAEWTQLTNYVSNQSEYQCGGNSSYIAKALASTEGWNTNTSNCAVGNDLTANNATGFSAVPAGYCIGSSFYYAGTYANFWSATRGGNGPHYAYYRNLFSPDARVYGYDDGKYYGYSVRCLRDESGNTAQAPTVTTSLATDLTQTSATLNGTVSNPDNVTITAQGFEWKATEGGTYAQVNAAGGTMTYSLTGLTANTSYTYRAFVTTASGTSYGEEVAFTTLSAAVIDSKSCPEAQTVTDHEGNVYATVQIGNQCWMRDNLRTTTSPSTGTYLIPAADANYTYTGKQARWYNNDSATYAPMNYGLLYNWNAAVDTFNTAYGETSVNGNAVSVKFSGHRRGICPAGWHLPSDAEWNTMEATVSGSDWQTSYETGAGYRGSHAGKLAGGDNWTTGTTSGAPGDYGYTDRDVSGFSAVPAGYCDGSSFNDAGNRAYFWSSFQHASNPTLAWYRDLSYSLAGVSRYYDIKRYGYSVRCLRD